MKREKEPLINWKALVDITQEGRPIIRQDSKEVWDKNTKAYIQFTKMEVDFTSSQLNVIPLQENDEVLDCGCGWGRIVLPLAKRVKKVTAMDNSEIMMDACRQSVKEANLENVDFAFLDFDLVEVEKDIKKHDVVICSKSRGIDNLKKLSNMSKRIVAIMVCSNAPNIRHIKADLFKGTSKYNENIPKPDRRISYNILFNQVYDLGYEPQVSIVQDGFTKTFDSKDEAYEELSKLKEFDLNKIDTLKSNIDKYLVQNEDGSVTFLFETNCVVIWWDVNTKNWNDWLR